MPIRPLSNRNRSRARRSSYRTLATESLQDRRMLAVAAGITEFETNEVRTEMVTEFQETDGVIGARDIVGDSAPLSGGPDLRAFALNADSTGTDEVTSGQTIDVFFDYDNIGSADVLGGDYDIGFYLSDDPVIDASDSLLTFVNGVDLAGGGAFFNDTISVTLPDEFSPVWASGSGTYYFGMFVDDLDEVLELDETNNTLSDDLDVTVLLPDLRSFALNADVGGTDDVASGQTIDVFFDYDNVGSAGVLGDDYDIGFYVSDDPIIEPGIDTLVTFLDGVDLAGDGALFNDTISVTLPDEFSPAWASGSGTYYFGMFVDDLGGVFELNETNNSIADDLIVTVPTPDLRAFDLDVEPGGDDMVDAGETVDVFFDYDNFFGARSVLGSEYEVGFYISDDPVIDASDSLVTFIQGVDLAAGGIFNDTINITLPGAASSAWSSGSGTYYLGMWVDDLGEVQEFDESNNTLTDDLTVNVPSAPNGDFDNDGNWDCDDVDELVAEIVAGTDDPIYDVTMDGFVTAADLDLWLALAGAAPGSATGGDPYLYGDANLDGTVDGIDFIVWNDNKFSGGNGWCGADFNADGTTDGLDFIVWNDNKFTSADAERMNGQPMVARSMQIEVIREVPHDDAMLELTVANTDELNFAAPRLQLAVNYAADDFHNEQVRHNRTEVESRFDTIDEVFAAI